MIPISADQVLTHKDEESGITYKFKPLLGDAEYFYFSAMEAVQGRVNIEPFVEAAKKDVIKNGPGKMWAKGEMEIAIRKKAAEMSVEGLVRTTEEIKKELESMNALIDAVLTGWDAPKGKKVPVFKAPPSGCFRYADKVKLFKIIMELNQDLTETEEKN